MANNQKKMLSTKYARLAEPVRGANVFMLALWVSLLIHVVLLSLKFQPELKKIKDSLPTLEVMLVNTKTKQAPEKADVLAQAHLDRGGNTDADKKMKTAMPATVKKLQQADLQQTEAKRSERTAQLQADVQREQQHVEALEKEAKNLMTQLESLKAVTSAPAKKSASTTTEQGEKQRQVKTPLDTNALIESAKEIDRLEALIAKQQDEYQKRPRKKFMGARTKEYRFAMYVESWRQKVERIGNLNYPEAAKNQKLYGQLQMTVEIRADGSIVNVTINRSSGHQVLDDAAKRIVQLASPFAAFPEDIKKDTDILSITRTWTFTQEDAFSTE